MAVTHGHYGTVRGGSHFLAPDNDLTWGAGTINIDGVGMVSVNEGTLEWTVDEPNGVVAFTTDTGDNDNCCLMLGAFQPSTQGGMFCEARFKFNSATLGSVFVGFTETLVLATPVMPAEFATATMTYNGSGGMIGAQFDTDATTNDFRACAGDGGAVSGSIVGGASVANGIRANETIAADEWYLVRVEVDVDGTGRIYVGHKGRGLDLISEYDTAPITNSDLFYAICMFENRSAAARVFEVDYFFAEAHADWEVT